VSAQAIGWLVFACVFGGALLGMVLRAVLPEHHQSPDSRDVVKLGMGLLGTMAALVLGLLIASAKSSYDTQNTEVKQAAANILLLDHVLAQYGPATRDIRNQIRRALAIRLAIMWPEEPAVLAQVDEAGTTPTIESIERVIRALAPQDDVQRGLQARAVQIVGDLLQTRWLLFGGVGGSLPMPFLVVLVGWLAVLFASFGLFAPRNATVIAVLLVCALSVSAAMYLIVELDRPFEGLLKIRSAPLRYTLAHLEQ